jgi:hypothetical protein
MRDHRRLFSGAALVAILVVAAITFKHRPVEAQELLHHGVLNVRDVDVAARIPFQTTLSRSTPTIRLHHNRRLTIEFVSAQCTNQGTATNGSEVNVVTTVGGTTAGHFFATKFVLVVPVGGGPNVYRTSEVVRIYADPATDVGFSAPFDCLVTLSGYLSEI